MNIFYPKAPLHDGAVVISNGRLMAAACIRSLAEAKGQSFGTRHRAALRSDAGNGRAVTVVVQKSGAKFLWP